LDFDVLMLKNLMNTLSGDVECVTGYMISGVQGEV
jgi:hypothetical protein